MKVQATHIANLFSYAEYKGVEQSELKKLLINQNIDLCDINNFVTGTEFLSVLKEMINRTKDPDFGLHFGCYHNIKALGFITQLSLNTTSIEQAVLVLQNYLENSFPLVKLYVYKIKGNFKMELTSEIDGKELKRHVLEIVFAFIFRELKLMLPEKTSFIAGVHRNDVNKVSSCLNAEITKSKKYSFIFDDKILNTVINQKTAHELELLLPQFLKMLDKGKKGYKPFSIKIRNMLLNLCTPELPSFEQVAAQFPLSNRTIQRKLTDEGLTFRTISDEIKHEFSDYLSKGKNIQTKEIAYLLGYSSSSSYLHAVSKWRGN